MLLSWQYFSLAQYYSLYVGYFHNCKEFLDNTYFVETPSAIPNGCPCNLRGAAGNYVIGED